MKRSKRGQRRSVVRNANYFIGEAVAGIMRNKVMSVSSIATIASCVFIVVFSICLVMNIDFVFRQIEGTAGVVVRVEKGLDGERLVVLRDKILEVEYVDPNNILFFTEDEEFEKAREMHGESYERFRGNHPFRAAFEVGLTDARQLPRVVEGLRLLAPYGAEEVQQPMDVLDIFIMVNNVIRIISIVIVLILAVLSVVIVMNTIKLTVSNRRNEILIMKYVGATDMFVRWPFIIEGILIGIMGAVIPLLTVGFTYSGAIRVIYNNFFFTELSISLRAPGEIFPWLAPCALLIGAGIGAAGSITSMKRYLQA
jgi:cell division transport system permease protein